MTAAPITLRVCTRSYATVAATGDVITTGPGQPDIYATVERRGPLWHWTIWTTGSAALGRGRAWTRDGAVGNAIAAAHRPGIGKAVTR
jgi:hypothetical protein